MQVSQFARKTASTFAPRASGKQNPAFKGTCVPLRACCIPCSSTSAPLLLTLVTYAGSVLYSVFEWQAYLSVVVGGLLSFNVLFPSDQPTIARLMGCAPVA